VLVEHRNGAVAGSTLSTVAAAAKLGGPITALVAGQDVGGVAESMARVQGVGKVRGLVEGLGFRVQLAESSTAAQNHHGSVQPTLSLSHPIPTNPQPKSPPLPPPHPPKVLVADSPALRHQTPEPYAELLAALQRAANFTHIVAPASTFGKNLLPRAAALLDCQPAADVVQVVDGDTFVRPIYAGNAMATVKFTTPGLRMFTVGNGVGLGGWVAGVAESKLRVSSCLCISVLSALSALTAPPSPPPTTSNHPGSPHQLQGIRSSRRVPGSRRTRSSRHNGSARQRTPHAHLGGGGGGTSGGADGSRECQGGACWGLGGAGVVKYVAAKRLLLGLLEGISDHSTQRSSRCLLVCRYSVVAATASANRL